jgi:plasmid stability protein
MRFAWNYTEHMSTMIQIRNVPSEVHRKLKARAALAGMSLSEYLLREVRSVAEQPTLEEIKERLSKLTPVRTRLRAAAAVRAERDGR